MVRTDANSLRIGFSITSSRKILKVRNGVNNTENQYFLKLLEYSTISLISDLTTILAALSPEDKNDECIKHALKIRSAWWLGNFHAFFKLYRTAPRMSAFLMDWFVARERKKALKFMIKSYVLNITSCHYYLDVCLNMIFIFEIISFIERLRTLSTLVKVTYIIYILILTNNFNFKLFSI